MFALLAMVPELVTTGVYREFVEVTGFSPMFSAPGRTACPLYDVDVELGKHGEIRLKSVRRLTEEEAFAREDSARPHPVNRTETKALRVGEDQKLLRLSDRAEELGIEPEALLGLAEHAGLTTDQLLEANRKTGLWIDRLNFLRKRGHTG